MGSAERGPAAFVLAGGKSVRMGADKAFVEYEGRTLLARALELAKSVSDDVRIVGSREKFARHGDVVEDVFWDCGPLAGIHAALRASQRELNLMLAVDMPFISSRFLRYLVADARIAKSTVVVPRAGGRLQPLCAIYRCEFADVAETALQAGRNKIDALFATVTSRFFEEDELEHAGFSGVLFRNLNSPEQLREFVYLTESSRHS